MKDLITKSLFDAVYNCDISKDDDMLRYYNKINIYEFAFKCKEWANTQDYWTQSGYEINHLGNYFCMIKDMPDNQFFYADTEIEAIFLASEYILNNIKQ